MIINPIMQSGEKAEIFITGLSSTDTVTCTSPSGRSIKTSWVDTSRLPSGFQEVEYIQSPNSEGSYIRTSLAPEGYYTEIDFTPLGYLNSSYNFILGAEISAAGGNRNSPFNWSSSRWGYSFRSTYGSTSTSITFGTRVLAYAKVVSGSYYYTIDGTQIYSSSATGTATSNALTIFADGFSSDAGYYAYAKLYSLKVWNTSNVLIGNFVPCYCTTTVTGYQGSTAVSCASGTIGLYDLVNDRFYINSGSDAFTKGSDVSSSGWSIPCAEYGTYSITATNGTLSKSTSVLVDAAEEFDIEMDYRLYLYKEGDQCTDVTGGWEKKGYIRDNVSSFILGSSSITLDYSGTGSTTSLGTVNKIDMSNYTTLYIRLTKIVSSWSDEWGVCGYFSAYSGTTTDTSTANIRRPFIQSGDITNTTLSFDISEAEDLYIYLLRSNWGSTSATISEIVYEMWLE